ncbi:MAG: hypothetical protein OEX00_00325 [Gammaproteobacteria bacterium]|nr:hypothetical protein [Gammaproteobacteria bacterium]MDH5692440.1 hypothetical protein [Gammaproteobacteria bacterium]
MSSRFVFLVLVLAGLVGCGKGTQEAADREYFTLSGAVTGLDGEGLVLVNGSDSVGIPQNPTLVSIPFTFKKALPDSETFNVVVSKQPQNRLQYCEPKNNSGRIDGLNITNIEIHCVTESFPISGTINGLSGSGLAIQVNDGEIVTLSESGIETFAFSSPLPSGDSYKIKVVTPPTNPSQACIVNKGNGDIIDSAIEDVEISCFTNQFTISGVASGLEGTGLKLKNTVKNTDGIIKGEQYITVSGNEFGFSSPVLSGWSYNLSIAEQPQFPFQSCNITQQASGTISDGDVNSVSIACITNEYTVSGNVSNLLGSNLKLSKKILDSTGQVIGEPDIFSASNSGSFDFSFNEKVKSGYTYVLDVNSQPTSPWQTCNIVEGKTAKVQDSPILTPKIVCTTNTYKVAGEVNNLLGSGLDLQLVVTDQSNNTIATQAKSIVGTGTIHFDFETGIESGHLYKIIATSQPELPYQTCVDIEGTITNSNQSNLTVDCSTNAYKIGGNLTGLYDTSSLELISNEGETLTLSQNGAFFFETPTKSGEDYSISVSKHPAGQKCSIDKPTASVTNLEIMDIAISCQNESYAVGGTISGHSGQIQIKNSTGEALTIAEGQTTFRFSEKVEFPNSYSVDLLTKPFRQDCFVDNSSGRIDEVEVNNISIVCYDKFELSIAPLSNEVTLTWDFPDSSSFNTYYSTDIDCDFENFSTCENGTLVTNVSSPFVVGGLTNGNPYYFKVEATLQSNHRPSSILTGTKPNAIGFNDSVDAISISSDGTAYLGGKFTVAGPVTGGALAFDTSRATAAMIPDFPVVTGTVNTVIEDGNNGWYLGGKFTHVGGVPRNNLAHIRVDGSVDPVWAPSTDRSVNALSKANDVIYIVGDFKKINGVDQPYAAAVNISGTLAAWKPNPDNYVKAISILNDTIYIGGHFKNVGGKGRNYLAAITSLGEALDGWNPSPDGPVWALASSQNSIFVSGYFSNIAGYPRKGLVSINKSGALNVDWVGESYISYLNLPSPPNVLVVSENILYAGGGFNGIIGGKQRFYIAALDISTGQSTDWSPKPNDTIHAIAVSPDTVYVGGEFSRIGNKSQSKFSAIDKISGIASDWSVNISFPEEYGYPKSLVLTNNQLIVSGSFSMLGGKERSHLASIDTLGKLTDWAPNTNNAITALHATSNGIFVSGYFYLVNGSRTNSLVKISESGVVSNWNPGQFSGFVLDFEEFEGKLYAGGHFGMFGGEYRNNLAAIDLATGTITDWNPNANNKVTDIEISNNIVFATGSFTSIGGEERGLIGSVSAETGSVTSWNPNASACITCIVGISALEVDDTSIYVSGAFSLFAGSNQNSFASFDKNSGLLKSWNPLTQGDHGYATSMIARGSAIYMGGSFFSISNQQKGGLVAIDASTGAFIDWNPTNNSQAFVSDLVEHNGKFFAGGLFNSIGNQPRARFSIIGLDGKAQ